MAGRGAFLLPEARASLVLDSMEATTSYRESSAHREVVLALQQTEETQQPTLLVMAGLEFHLQSPGRRLAMVVVAVVLAPMDQRLAPRQTVAVI